ncbi:hypothetical protein AMJ83_01315 [candidate division WOR_3 bacterium SM23_42]|uniref:Putative zinc-finger domain-containing protein n=1 Tax=candidate division WOR_3 bacterium SM23_42 TaxID=1703779 RepID=A0A0S8FW28_UNCW3|nr:MAG: hypothetical protein AMJ83_01315 [candidate division WOR_3 bacterium SM23_42]
MKICEEFTRYMVDCLEKQLSAEDRARLMTHIEKCADCRKEYRRLENLYGIMDKDDVTLPPQEYFETIKAVVSKQGLRPKRLPLKVILKVLIPTFTAAAILMVVLRPPSKTIEYSIPVANLIQDEEIAEIAIEGIIDEEIAREILAIEDYLLVDNDDVIEELTADEKKEFVNSLHDKYRIGT